MTDKKIEEKDLSVAEVMRITEAKRSTVTRWCRNGKLPNAYKVVTEFNTYWMIPPGDLNELPPEIKLGRPRKDET